VGDARNIDAIRSAVAAVDAVGNVRQMLPLPVGGYKGLDYPSVTQLTRSR
jgi:hypothetical protein